MRRNSSDGSEAEGRARIEEIALQGEHEGMAIDDPGFAQKIESQYTKLSDPKLVEESYREGLKVWNKDMTVDGEAVRHSCIGKELLCLVEILRSLRNARVRRGIERRERTVVPEVRLPLP